MDFDEGLSVEVDLRNEDGDQRTVYGYGMDTDEAVQNAIERTCRITGDDTWVMNDWKAA